MLLAHNLTPHQHDTEQIGHHHGHDHDDDDDHDGDSEKNSFHFFQHIGESGIEFTSGQFIKYDVQKKVCETAVTKLATHFLSYFEKPPTIAPLLRTKHLSIQQTTPYFFLLKAPPTFTA